MFFSLDAKVICIQVCRLAWDVFCFFVFICAPWDEKLQWSELIYLCCLWSLLCLLLLMLSVTVGAATLQLHVATCYLTAKESDVTRSCSPSWCCSFALTHLKKLILWTCLKVFFNSLEARLILQTGPPKPQGTVYAEQPLLIYFQS